MAWEDTLLDASFKGVQFDVVRASDGNERDVATYIYPYRDGAELDDLGRGARQYDIEGVFFGEGYEERLQAFLATLDEPGPGELIHPIYGSIPRAQLAWHDVGHDAERPEFATVRMQFMVGEEENPFLSRQLPAGRASEASDYARTLDELGAQKYTDQLRALRFQSGALGRLNAVRDVMSGVLSGVRGLVGSYVTGVSDLLDAPRTFLGDLASGLGSLVDLRQLTGDNLMPEWGGLFDSFRDVIRLPAGVRDGNIPIRFTEGATTPPAAVSGANPADIAAVTAATRLVVATAAIDVAAEVLAEQADRPTLAPAEIEQIAADVREIVQAAIEEQRTDPDIVRARPIGEALRESALAIQDAAAAVIHLLPPLANRPVSERCNLRLLAHRWYGDHERAVELARLNPGLRRPNDLTAGDTLNAYSR